MKIKNILPNGNTYQGSKKIGVVKYKEEYVDKIMTEFKDDPQRLAFIDRLGLYSDESLIFTVRNGFAYVSAKNRQHSEKLNDTDIISDKEWDQDVETLKEKIKKIYKDRVMITFLI